MRPARAAFCLALILAPVSGCSRTTPDSRRTTLVAAASSFFAGRLPPGLPPPRVPRDNPLTSRKVELGRRLFYDTRLSGNGTYACASCHQQARAFTDGRAQAVGSTGASHARSTMALANVAYHTSFGWADADLRSLEAQMTVPMFNEHPIELGLKGREADVAARFAARADEVAEFRAAFPETEPPVSLETIVKAIASFERTLLSGDSPVDRYMYRDDRAALSPAARRGMTLFFSARLKCGECHSGFNLSGPVTFEGADTAKTPGKTEAPELLFHNTGLYNVDGRGAYPATDRGLFDKTRKPQDMGRFRAPTLRNVAVTAPYMHDGSLPTLDAVVAHYASGGTQSPLKSDRVNGFAISAAETADLVEFLKSLTDQAFLTNPAFAAPVPFAFDARLRDLVGTGRRGR